MKKAFLISFVSVALLLTSLSPAFASPWAEKEGYFPKTAGKLEFGLKNSLFGWGAVFTEPYKPIYQQPGGKKPWEGFWVGIARAIVYTGNGLIHLATFPIPVDVPNIGHGL